MNAFKEQIQDFLLKMHFVLQSPAVGAMSLTAWCHGMRFSTDRITYNKEFADLCESVGLPRKLPKPEYPKEIWAAFGEEIINDIAKFDTIFEGHMKVVSEWCKENEGNYHHMGVTGRYFQTEQEMFEKWRTKVLNIEQNNKE